MTTTHVSAGRRRRQRLRRVLLVVVALVATVSGYAAWHDDGADATAQAGGASRPVGGVSTAAVGKQVAVPKPVHTDGSSATHPVDSVGGKGFAAVVTDRIPVPTTSLALSAPVPGTTNMQASAAAAFRSAFAAARAQGLTPEIRSAWRSAAWQQVLFDRAVKQYGSKTEASKWVLSPGRSAHVKGYAIDVHPEAMAAWLEQQGAAYGLCRTYDNEWWHFEYLATSTCPPRQPTAAG